MRIRLFTIPNLLTLANLFCGAMASVAALVWGDLAAAFWLIAAAAVCDFFDGFVARLLHQSSPIGVELDSLADVISFGFAPAAILFVMYGQAWHGAAALPDWLIVIGQYALFIMAAFSALRLARFNIDDTQQSEFLGLPVPANALFCASLGLLAQRGDMVFSQGSLFLIAIVMSLLLISPIRMFALKFKGFGWRGNELRYSFLLLCCVLLWTLRLKALPLIVILYVVISMGRFIIHINNHTSDGCDKL